MGANRGGQVDTKRRSGDKGECYQEERRLAQFRRDVVILDGVLNITRDESNSKNDGKTHG